MAAALGDRQSVADLEQQPLLGIHPGARSGARRWPVERYGEVVAALARTYQLRPVVLGTETELGAALRESLRNASDVIDLPPETGGRSWRGDPCLALFIGNDSGLSHVAEALHIPSVIVYGASHPINWGSPMQGMHRIVADWSAPCRWFRPCGCPDTSDAPCLQAVSIERVLGEVTGLLDGIGRIQSLNHLALMDDQRQSPPLV